MYTKLTVYLALVLLIPGMRLEGQNMLIPNYLTFEPELPYNSAIPSPKSFLAYELGEAFTLYGDVTNYFKTIDGLSDKITVKTYGKTYEDRTLFYAIITSATNHQRLEEIRQNNLRLTDPLKTTLVEAQNIMKTQPLVVSYSYNIHGNEASSTEAAMQVAYRLIAAEDETTKQLLENVVFVMFPCINPDGRDRYVGWYKSMQRTVPGKEPYDLDHHDPWPNGRTNHYWFDLNRDWVWGVHPESRGHTAIYQQWMPQLHTDYHEMGYNNNYFTVPGTTPRNLLLPDRYEPLADTIGRANAAAFNKHKISFYTREDYDFFYPGYGSSYPSVMGAIGMLVEQGGISGGRVIETDDGTLLTLRQRIFDHYLTSLATLKKGVQHKSIFQQYSYDALHPKNSKSKTKAYFLPDDGSGYLYDVLQILQRHQVKIERATSAFSSKNTINYRTGKAETKQFPVGTFILSTEQNRHLFLNSVMSRNLAIEDSVMYDMATWSAPLAYNLDAFYTEETIAINKEVVTKLPEIEFGVENPAAQYAFVLDWNQRYAPKALAMLWAKGYRVRSALKSFQTNGKTFHPGSLTIMLGSNRQQPNIVEDMIEIATKAKVKIYGLDSGRMSDGIDAGSGDNRPLKAPKVALMIEPPFDVLSCGQLYFLFDQETPYPVDRIRTSILAQTSVPKFGSRYGLADLNDYDVLILPSGGNALSQVFDREALEQLKTWINGGGVLIASETAAAYFTQQRSKMTDVKLLEVKKDSSEAAKYVTYEDREDFLGKKRIPGSAFNALIDNSNPLAFGMKPELYSLRFDTDVLQPDANLQTVGYYSKNKENLLVAGLANTENINHLSGNTFAAVKQMGQGKVIFLMDNTQYRMFWIGGMRMMQNAVLLMPSF